MNEYLTSEVVIDYADGLINRREALRRLGLLGVAATLATSMLAACSPGTKAPADAKASTDNKAPRVLQRHRRPLQRHAAARPTAG